MSWESLGSLLTTRVADAERKLLDRYRSTLDKLIELGGAPDESHPLRVAARDLVPDLDEGELLLYATCSMDDSIRGLADQARLVRSLRDIWGAIQEDREDCLRPGNAPRSRTGVGTSFGPGKLSAPPCAPMISPNRPSSSPSAPTT